MAFPRAKPTAEMADEPGKIKFSLDEIMGLFCRPNHSADFLWVPLEDLLTQHAYPYHQTRNGTILRPHIGSIEDGRDWRTYGGLS